MICKNDHGKSENYIIKKYTGYTVYLTLIIIPESDKLRMHPLHHETTGKDF